MTTPDPQLIAVTAVVWVLSVGLHEAGHAYTADRLGDPTPEMFGRLTLNPFAHLKPVATAIVLPLVLFFVSGWIFGGATTPTDPSRFRKPLRDRLLVAIAGPAVNLACAGLGAAAYLLGGRWAPAGSLNYVFLTTLVHLNLILLIFNMLPVPGLDGGYVARYFLPPGMRESFDSAAPYGIAIVMMLFFIPAVSLIVLFPVFAIELLVFGDFYGR